MVFLLSKFGTWLGMLWKTLHVQLVGILAMFFLLLLARHPPPPGVFKVNVDGASSDQDGSSSVGVVIRDSNGQIMAALCLPLQSHFSAELTEVFALE